MVIDIINFGIFQILTDTLVVAFFQIFLAP